MGTTRPPPPRPALTLAFPSRARLPVNILLRLCPFRDHMALKDSTKRSAMGFEFSPRLSSCRWRTWERRGQWSPTSHPEAAPQTPRGHRQAPSP